MEIEKEPESGGEKQTDTHITVIKTSSDILSEPGGKTGGVATVDSKVQEGSQGRGTFTQTSQQINGEISLCESDTVA